MEVWDSPCSKLEVPGNDARKILDGVDDHTPRWEPQEEGMMQSSENFPRLRNQGYQSSRTSKTWTRLLVVWRYNKRGTCTQHTNSLLPQLPERLSIFQSYWNLRIKRIEYMGSDESENGTEKKQWRKKLNGGCNNEENRTEGHGFTSCVSPKKIACMKGKQITAGQLTNHEGITILLWWDAVHGF